MGRIAYLIFVRIDFVKPFNIFAETFLSGDFFSLAILHISAATKAESTPPERPITMASIPGGVKKCFQFL
jgi:hypothetical protein